MNSFKKTVSVTSRLLCHHRDLALVAAIPALLFVSFPFLSAQQNKPYSEWPSPASARGEKPRPLPGKRSNRSAKSHSPFPPPFPPSGLLVACGREAGIQTSTQQASGAPSFCAAIRGESREKGREGGGGREHARERKPTQQPRGEEIGLLAFHSAFLPPSFGSLLRFHPLALVACSPLPRL